MKLNFIIAITFALTISSIITTDIIVKPLDAEKQLVVSVDASCSKVRFFRWSEKSTFPKEEATIDSESPKDFNYMSFDKGFALKLVAGKIGSIKDEAAKKALTELVKKAKEISGCTDDKDKKHRLRHHQKKHASNQTLFDSVYTYVLTADASKIAALDRNTKYLDKTKQYFDSASDVTEYYEDIKATPKKWNKDLSVASVLADFKIKGTKLAIETTKIYTRFSGKLPKDQVKVEMDKARSQPKDHLPSTVDAFIYFVLKVDIEERMAMTVQHAILELCMKSDQNEHHRFMIDRGSRESAFSDTWATRVRIIYLGKVDNCQQKTLETEVAIDVDGEPHLHKYGEGPVENISFQNLLTLTKQYVEKFPVYNTLVNCQHFAFNVYNELVDKDIDYESAVFMEDHTDKSGKQDGKSIKFGLKLAKAARKNLHRMKKNKRSKRQQ